MSFTGFRQADFDTFAIEGLAQRMEAIQQRIQPKFRQIGEQLLPDICMIAGEEMFLHIARHARRKVNPPKDTWLAFANNKRGYKQHPHFQIGLFDDRVFLWFALIYELPNKKKIATTYLQSLSKVYRTIPANYVLSFDHMSKDSVTAGSLGKSGLQKQLERFRDVNKAEFLAGRHLAANDPVLQDGEAFVRLAKETFTTLAPLYKLAFE